LDAVAKLKERATDERREGGSACGKRGRLIRVIVCRVSYEETPFLNAFKKRHSCRC